MMKHAPQAPAVAIVSESSPDPVPARVLQADDVEILLVPTGAALLPVMSSMITLQVSDGNALRLVLCEVVKASSTMMRVRRRGDRTLPRQRRWYARADCHLPGRVFIPDEAISSDVVMPQMGPGLRSGGRQTEIDPTIDIRRSEDHGASVVLLPGSPLEDSMTDTGTLTWESVGPRPEIERPMTVIDISGGGCCLVCTEPIDRETEVKVKFKLPDKEVAEYQASVRWVKERQVAARDRWMMGLQFGKLPEKERSRLVRCVFRLEVELRRKGLDQPPSVWTVRQRYD